MPLYYNTDSPTPGNKNTITKTATDFGLRDFLLNKNIINPITYPQLSTSINGAPRGGEPVLDTMVGTGVVLPHVPIEVDGIFHYTNAVVMNHYKDTTPGAPAFLNIENIPAAPIFPTSPNGTSNYAQEDITKYGILAKSDSKEYRKKSTLRNLYLDASKQVDVADIISLQPIQTAQQLPSYDQAWGALTIGGAKATKTANIIGSVLNGQGVGIDLAKGGFATNYDVRASLAGRVLGATGLLNDTKLGIIGGQQLALALANNAAFNIEQEILGKLNISENILNILKGDNPSFRPNYKITVASSLGGQLINTASKILGFTVPRSYLEPGGSIFFTESGNISNIKRANQMLENTGKGQRQALADMFKANLNGISPEGHDNPLNSKFRSGYSPRYQKGDGGDFIVNGNPKLYAFDTEPNSGIVKPFLNGEQPINDMNYNREGLVEGSSFNDFGDTYGNGTRKISTPSFSWSSTKNDGDTKPINALPQPTGGLNQSDTYYGYQTQYTPAEYVGDKKSLLTKTQLLFGSKGMKNIVSTKGDMSIGEGSQLQTSVVNGGISKGSAVLKGDLFDINGNIANANNDAENTFCRAWTTYDRYDRVYKLIRHRGLNQSDQSGASIIPENNKWRINTKGSVLDDNGFVKIAPYKDDNLTRQNTDPKKYMFSIENLAWAGSPAVNLLPVEQGPGDLITGKFGRIMWFPPYDLTFSETSTVSLETTNFIGRGEPIYTYNNTERTGNLSFKIIIDHPSIMNAFKGNDGPPDEFIRSWFAGCVDLNSEWANKLTKEEQVNQETRKEKKVTKTKIPPVPAPDPIKIYFKNDITVIDPAYESGSSSHMVLGPFPVPGLGPYTGEPQKRCATCPLEAGDVWPDDTDFGFNNQSLKIPNSPTIYPNWNDPTFIADLTKYLKDTCPTCKAKCTGYASSQGVTYSNQLLAKARAKALRDWIVANGILDDSRIEQKVESKVKNGEQIPYQPKTPPDQKGPKADRYAAIIFVNDTKETVVETEEEIEVPVRVSLNQQIKNRFYNEAQFFEKLKQDDRIVYDSIKEKIKFFDPSFHSMTPEGFNSRLTFLLQCTRQGATISDIGPRNLAFGTQPVCILRIGDFYNTKIMIDSVTFDYEPLVWDLNPEGVGVQPMIANVSMSFKYIGGSSLYSPINKLQNALSFNYFANTQTYDPRADTVAVVPGKERTTFKETNPDAKKEPVYTLVPGLDSTKDSMGAIVSNEVSSAENNNNNTKDGNQVKSNENATSTANNPNGNPDLARIKLSGLTSSVLNFGQYSTVSFDIIRVSNTDNTSLSKNYDLTVNIKNNTTPSESFEIKLPKQLDAATIGIQNFDFGLADMTPSCTGLTLTSSSYNFNVIVGDAGTLSATIDKIPGGATATTATTIASTTNFTDDDVFRCLSLGFPAATNISNNSFDINFTFNPHETLTSPKQTVNEFIFKQSHSGKVYLVENNTTNSQKLLATLEVKPNTSNDGVTFGGSDEIGQISQKNVSGKPPQPWSVKINLKDSLDIVKSALTKSDTAIKISWDNGVIQNANWSYPSQTSTSSFDDMIITGSLIANNCDSAHNFTSMIQEINEAQQKIYDRFDNPKIKKFDVKIYKTGNNFYTQEYDVIIGNSTDGKAWVGFESRGSCGSGYIERADNQYYGTGQPGQSPSSPCYLKSLAKCMQDNANAVDVELVKEYQNDTDQFKQFFVQFTKSTYPAH